MYVDDRAWVIPDASMCVQVRNAWRVWGQVLGLVENAQKDQFYHRAAKGRRDLYAAGDRRDARRAGDKCAILARGQFSDSESELNTNPRPIDHYCFCLSAADNDMNLRDIPAVQVNQYDGPRGKPRPQPKATPDAKSMEAAGLKESLTRLSDVEGERDDRWQFCKLFDGIG